MLWFNGEWFKIRTVRQYPPIFPNHDIYKNSQCYDISLCKSKWFCKYCDGKCNLEV